MNGVSKPYFDRSWLDFKNNLSNPFRLMMKKKGAVLRFEEKQGEDDEE
jgi:hypothetical protein